MKALVPATFSMIQLGSAGWQSFEPEAYDKLWGSSQTHKELCQDWDQPISAAYTLLKHVNQSIMAKTARKISQVYRYMRTHTHTHLWWQGWLWCDFSKHRCHWKILSALFRHNFAVSLPVLDGSPNMYSDSYSCLPTLQFLAELTFFYSLSNNLPRFVHVLTILTMSFTSSLW